jgi:hypothetical protein
MSLDIVLESLEVNAALVNMNLELGKNEKCCESFVTDGGCFALVQLMKNCLDNAIERIPACDQVTELNELAELTTLDNTFDVIVSLTFRHAESRVDINKIGGVEAIVKVMKTFPKCRALQLDACSSLVSLACCCIGRDKVVKTNGINAVLSAVNNHLDSAVLCQKACWALVIIVSGSKKNTGLLISLGGATAVAKVRAKWRKNDLVQNKVQRLATIIIAEMKTWVDEA